MRWGSVLVGALAVCLLVGCGFDDRSNAFACETQVDCTDGRACEMGWCVVPGAGLPDADLQAIDAAPPVDAMPDATPPPECLACADDTCTEDCTVAGNCAYDCSVGGCDCSFSCTADANKCNGECKVGTTCSVDCGGAKQCHPKCNAGAVCDFDCTGVQDCRKAKCEGDAQCILNCTGTGAMDCKFDVCGGVEMSCPGDIKVCGRDCPL